MYSRRDFGKTALAALAAGRAMAAAKPNSKMHGVQIGAQSYSFRDRPLDEAIQAIAECGLERMRAVLADTWSRKARARS